MLAAAITAAGAHATVAHFVADDVDAFRAALRAATAGMDLIVTSGGVSAGAYEVVKDALTGQGVEFAKVAMQPGMPQGAGHFDGIPMVTLPGNPVSSYVSFEVFLRPAIRAAMGYQQTHPAGGAAPAVRGRSTPRPASASSAAAYSTRPRAPWPPGAGRAPICCPGWPAPTR